MTDTVIFKNNATSRLKIDIPSASITITVETGTGARFPAPAAAQFFPVIVSDQRTGQFEIMYCTARVNDILTVTRAQEGTVAQDFLMGASVWSTATAGVFTTYFGYAWSKDEADARFVNAGGDVMTGALALPGNPTIAKHATTKEWVEALVGSVTSLVEAPNDGQPYARQSLGWVVTVTKADYDSNNVSIANALASDDVDIAALQTAMVLKIGDAPSDGNEYIRKNAAWAILGAALTDAPSDGSVYGRRNAVWTKALPLAGGTMTGVIVLSADPAAALQPSTKQYTDAADALRLLKTGGTLTGALTLAADPAAPLQPATKQYTDAAVAANNALITANTTAIGNRLRLDAPGGYSAAQKFQGKRNLGVDTYPGLLQGLRTANNSGLPTNTILFDAGFCADSSGSVMIAPASMTKKLDAAWASGTGNGGLMSAAALADGTYFMFAIYNNNTDVADFGFDVSPTAPTLPGTYTHFRRIGAVVRLGGFILRYTQNGDWFLLHAPTRTITAANPGTGAVTRTLLRVPVGIQVVADVLAGGNVNTAGIGWYGLLSPLSTAGDVPTNTLYNFNALQDGQNARVLVETDTLGRIRSQISASAASDTLLIIELGWFDTRGK